MVQVGNYMLGNIITRGGNSVIYDCTNVDNDKDMVAKVIRLIDVDAEKLFHQESSILKRLQASPNIITVNDIMIKNSYGFLILPRMRQDLLEVLEAEGSFSEIEAKMVFFQVCSAIQACHKKGIAHLDIKPENILQGFDGNYYLADFGCSFCRQAAIGSTTKGNFGTYIYSAPEVRNHLEYDPFAADIWSLGILLHVLLTGAWPYDVEPKDFKKSTPLAILPGKFPGILDNLLWSMLRVQPKKRITINEILRHPWFDGMSDNYVEPISEDEEYFDDSLDVVPVHIPKERRFSFLGALSSLFRSFKMKRAQI